MPRKPKLPGAADFFKAGGAPREAEEPVSLEPDEEAENEAEEEGPTETSPPPEARGSTRRVAGHDLTAGQVILTPAQLRATQVAAPAHALPQPITEKVTFYVPPQMLQQLEVCRVRLLTERNIKANRSQIAVAAMALCIHDTDLIAETLLQLAEIWQGQVPE